MSGLPQRFIIPVGIATKHSASTTEDVSTGGNDVKPDISVGGEQVTNIPVSSRESSGDGDVTSTKSSISVIFTDWVPDPKSETGGYDKDPEPVIPNFQPTFDGGRPRYFQMHRGHRPGLGLSVDPANKRAKSKKRKSPSYADYISDGSLAKRLRITPDKPASQIIHEIDSGLQYDFEEVPVEGSKAAPNYTCRIKFPSDPDAANRTEFVGEGRSKKLAKNDAAEKLLASLGVEIPSKEEYSSMDTESFTFPTPYSPTQMRQERRFPFHFNQEAGNDIDFASDDIVGVNFGATDISSFSPMLSQPMVESKVLSRLKNIPNFEENITLALHTIYPGTVEYKCLGEDGPPHGRKFTVKVSFNNQEFIGIGGSKKKAKADAAKSALITLLGINCFDALVHNSPTLPQPLSICNSMNNSGDLDNGGGNGKTRKKKKKSKSKNSSRAATSGTIPSEQDGIDEDDGEDDQDDCGEYDLNFSDHIRNMVRDKMNEVISKESPYAAYKVLAGVVMTTSSPMIYNSKVIVVTTGTKCIDGDFMSPDGLSVNDSHAEILATRCVRDYLYHQIELLENAVKEEELRDCILQRNTESIDGQSPKPKYILKPEVKFHLYISTSPCGDARIFSPKGIELDEDEGGSASPADLEDTHPNKLNRGVLRSKIEAGEGTIPSANLYTGPQTWDSIVSGNALYTMSCSDKVCRWNVLGLQGALLHNFLGTIHYSSITLGSLHHPVHFKRAVYGRLDGLSSRLAMPFSVHKPRLMMVSNAEKRRVKKSPNHALCWSMHWSTPEILAASKGRCEPGGVASRLTKRLAFQRFLKLYQNATGRRENYADLTYREAKTLAGDYQKAKEELMTFFKDSKLGPWIGKPLEQDSFRIQT